MTICISQSPNILLRNHAWFLQSTTIHIHRRFSTQSIHQPTGPKTELRKWFPGNPRKSSLMAKSVLQNAEILTGLYNLDNWEVFTTRKQNLRNPPLNDKAPPGTIHNYGWSMQIRQFSSYQKVNTEGLTSEGVQVHSLSQKHKQF
jgi:hypothetical protein